MKFSCTHKNNSPYFILFYSVLLSVANTQNICEEHRPKKNTVFQYSFITQGLVRSVGEKLKAKCCQKLKSSSFTRESHLKIVQSIFECWGMKEYGKSSHAEGWFVSHDFWSSGDKVQIIVDSPICLPSTLVQYPMGLSVLLMNNRSCNTLH